MHASPAADRPTDLVEDPKSVSIRVRTAAAGLAYILTNEISRVFLEGSTAAAAGGSALTLTGLFEAY